MSSSSFFCLLLCVPPLAAAPPAVQRHALLVSLEQYPDGANIVGTHGMADALAETLITRCGFAPEDIHTLRDSEATKAGLFAAVDRYLVQGLGSDDVAVLWFAGHGGRIRDRNGDEDDGYDEVLCLWDVDEDPLIDDELPPLFAQVPATGFTVLLDCCHSGTATRGTPIDGELLLPLFQNLPPDLPHDAPPEGRDQPVGSAWYTVLSACRADQQAVAVQSSRDGNYLVFTKALIETLRGAELPLASGAALAAVRQRVTAMRKIPPGQVEAQQPQLEGPDPGWPILAPIPGIRPPSQIADLTIACDSAPLREACGEPDGGLWSNVPEQATLRVLAKEGDGWECSLLDRDGQVIETAASPTVADAGAWLRRAIARERLIQAARRLDSATPLPLRVMVEGDQMLVEATAPADWHLTIFEVLPTGDLLLLCPSPLFVQSGREATFVARSPGGRAMVYALATPNAPALPVPPAEAAAGTLRQMGHQEALGFINGLALSADGQTATASWVARPE